ncbi:CehA/McbA family metallohydrolase [uncultured Parasphingorhabdus sp.]|uniref:CehA/McbA family metallohydrolase n=1 Tax=uncultured Parasphingorhabdus sp. TaxID=2709694 RepID=UPI0030D83653|tara:strand:+ start:191 stop:1744 length:1554 start_codon:yes stop_codon:yes gene_type:complete
MKTPVAIFTLIAGLLCTAPALAQVETVRFGNLHAHSSYSDGLGEPAEAYEMACEAGLDFFAVTEHNHAAGDGKGERKDGLMIATQPDLYKGTPSSLVESADRLNRSGECVTIYGQEFSTISSGNHANIFDVDMVIDAPNGDFAKLLGWLQANPDSGGNMPLMQFNHPAGGQRARLDYGRDDFGGDEQMWVQSMAPHVSLIEMLNAPALRDGTHQRTHSRQGQYFRYLNLGFHLAPSVGQDNHYRNWGFSTDARVAVITSDFTRAGILSALRARRAYASEDKNLRVIFRSGDALQGDIANPPAIGAELDLSVQIVDDDEPDASYRIDLFKDVAGGKPVSSPTESYEVSGNQTVPLVLEGIRLEALGEYVLLRITQFGREDDEHAEDDVVWTAPIWFEPPSFHHLLDDLPDLRIVSMIPDPLGDDFTNEQITFRNIGSGPIDLAGWRVRDLAGNVWELDVLASIAAGEDKTLVRNGAPMSLNNGGDKIELVAPEGTVVQSVTYDKVRADEVVMADGITP